ncbi:DNA-formamidopyrimidine glycosylase [Furfurilactobacillus siliginis]|uniref:Formamidopyrimidine-DNA glycosylase n=1 Tax=Furfurilactobacillus siliginis TaxID=348151 RepID=A0A0R2KYC5_9LACO|nr:DNA-formamidopyrimidine glycosylase [Furfurilactobacillus siliginis]KRN94523.1 formamidopyrimidine-DNA glycosylase [Furfurilactobacillus siliginis]GEK28564.1 formamidopyrimidine-DNA glycosylase [Furfurilactobacillus siliginis]
MPELPEVETVRRGLTKMVVGKTITGIDVFYPKMILNGVDDFETLLLGQLLTAVDRRGKYLLFRFNGGLTMVSHLRMEGKYFTAPAGTPVDKHTHVIFHFDDGQDLCYNDTRKFGRMIVVKTGEENTVGGLKTLGPEPTPETLSVDYLVAKMAKGRKAIKTWLLDQNNVAGLGNIYCDEVLWLSKIHPEQPANSLTRPQIKRLRENIFAELTLAIEHHGTTVFTYSAFGHAGEFQNELHAYGHVGEPCERCGAVMVKIKVGERGTTYCPKEQKLLPVKKATL